MNIKSCTHYDNNLQIYATCCSKFYDCKLCHNELNDHKMEYDEKNRIKCINCNTESNVPYGDNNNMVTHCKNCKINFGKYHCNKCIIWCNKLKDIYHCDKCRSCKLGNKDKNYHCDGCNICLSINCFGTHNCKLISRDGECPICLNKLDMLGETIILLNCSHSIHKNCLNQLIENTDKTKKIPSCTLCKASVVKFNTYENTFDNYCRDSYLDYCKNWKNEIVCNDCSERSTVKYNKNYNKCKNENCRSYNTSILSTIKN